MSTNCTNNQYVKLHKLLAAVLSVFLILFISSAVYSQNDHQHDATCGNPAYAAHKESIYQKIAETENNSRFLERFKLKYKFDYTSFIDVNGYFINIFRQGIAEKTFEEHNVSAERIENLLFEFVDESARRDDLWFEIPADHRVDKIYYGKHVFNPAPGKENGSDDGISKTATCFNAGFEDNNWGGWTTLCATAATATFNAWNNENVYVPPGSCTIQGGSNHLGQHSLWTGGDDAVGNFPRVFNGGVSAMIGNGQQAGPEDDNRAYQTAILRKTFIVDPSNPIITYNYAAVMFAGSGHSQQTQPFFSVNLYINGVPEHCAHYSAYAGDGQAGWISAGGQRWYRNWTTVAVPLHAFIGETVILEFVVADCTISTQGNHWAYAYVDVSCGNMEVQQFCEGTSTVLSAPSEGIVAYEWSTGENTQNITITTPGDYTVNVLPYGSTCSALLTYNASIYPPPTADFSVNQDAICIGGDIDFTNLSTVAAGGTINSYQWDYGDGISTPASTGTISGIPQTTGTYEGDNNHVYTSIGDRTVTLRVTTDDDCYDVYERQIRVVEGPEAIIAGDTIVCVGDSPPEVTFAGYLTTGPYRFTYNIDGGPDQYVYADAISGGQTYSSVTVPVPTTSAGTYTYNLTYVADTSLAMCERAATGSVTVIVREPPVASISAPVEACHFDSALPEIEFTGTDGEEPYTFTYNINGRPDQSVTSTGSSVVLQAPTDTVGTFIYTITYIEEGSILSCGQSQDISTIVTIHALPDVSAGNDFTVCEGVEIVLTGSGAQTYSWDNAVTDGVPFIATDTTIYTVTGTDHNGCRNTDSVMVNVVPIPVIDIVGENLYGCQPLIPTLTNNSTGNLPNSDCTWSLGNGEVIQGCGSVATVFNNPGCYDVTLFISTSEGCSNTLTLNNYICVEANPVADFYPNPVELTTYNQETQMVNESSGAIHFEWDFGDGSAPVYGFEPSHAFPGDTEGIYTIMLVASTMAGCVDTAYAIVNVKEDLIFYIPNTFTPDQDNYNETFKPVFTTGFDPYNYTLYIYNRWGELIFESHDTDIGWNGRYGVDGKICQDGTYTWKIEVKKRTVDERKQFVGHVNLIR